MKLPRYLFPLLLLVLTSCQPEPASSDPAPATPPAAVEKGHEHAANPEANPGTPTMFKPGISGKPCSSDDCRTVIATAGLNLRTEPKSGSKIVEAVPFGGQVTVLQTEVSPVFEVGKAKGSWTKVSYQGKTGYMFSGFLSQEFFPTGSEERFHFWSGLSGCNNNVKYNPNFQYLAIEPQGNGRYKAIPVAISFHTELIEETGAEMMTVELNTDRHIFEEDAYDILVLGAVNLEQVAESGPMRERDTNEPYFNYTDPIDLPLWGSARISVEEKGFGWEFFLVNVETKARQQVDFASYVAWSGDLDGDGATDFVIADEKGTAKLYLSQGAEGDQMVRKVAAYRMGLCD